MAVYESEIVSRPDFYFCIGARVVDFVANDITQLQLLTDLEVGTLEPTDELLIIAANVK